VTVSEVEALLPGLIVRDELPKAAVQPAGTLVCKLKVEVEQEEVSEFVTLTVKATEVPAGTAAG
jgi:hypothetical protein